MPYGTLYTLDALKATSGATVAEIGEDQVFAGLETARQAHNRIFNEMMAEFVETGTDMLRRWGGPDTMVMDELDQFGIPDAQKVTAGATVGFPLREYGVTVQWTRDYLEVTSASELASNFTAAMDGDLNRARINIKKALYTATDNLTYKDNKVYGYTLPLKALINADSDPIPAGPNGETFDGSTHTHYVGTASLVAADVVAVLELVLEHYSSGEPVLVINRAQEAAIRAMTANFTAVTYANVIPATNANVGRGTQDAVQLYNRLIGFFNGAEVWVKPWAQASYIFAYVRGAPKPLYMRIRNENRGQFRIVAELEAHPLRARALEREYGIGVWNRVNGAVLYTASGTYASPTITA